MTPESESEASAEMQTEVNRSIREEAFVNRDELQTKFRNHMRGHTQAHVLNVHGLGGMGKTALLKQLRAISRQQQWPVALIDLTSDAEMNNALINIAKRLRKQGIKLPRFEFAFAVSWQARNADTPLKNDSDILVSIGAELIPALIKGPKPVVVTAKTLFELAAPKARQRTAIALDPDLLALDDLSPRDLDEAVLRFLARDLNDHETRSALLFDGYELLYDDRGGDSAWWIRTLAEFLEKSTIVVASTEPIDWRPSGKWSNRVDFAELKAFSDELHSQRLLLNLNVEREDRNRIAREAAGIPLWLKLAGEASRQGHDLNPSDGIYAAFVAHLSADERRLLDRLATLRSFDKELFSHLRNGLDTNHRWGRLPSISLYQLSGESGQSLHPKVAEAIKSRLVDEYRFEETHQFVADVREDLGHAEPDLLVHRFASGDATADDVLETADQLRTDFGMWRQLEFARDIRSIIPPSTTNSHIPEAAEKAAEAETLGTLLTALSSIELGEIEVVLDDLTDDFLDRVGLPMQGRMHVVRGHAERIAGRTRDSLAWYNRAAEGTDEKTAFDAKLWAADIAMASGDFVGALSEEFDLASRSDIERARLHRQRSIAHRLQLDLERATVEMDAAKAALQRIGGSKRTEILALEVEVAELELNAWKGLTQPTEANSLLEELKQARVRPELGKARTALAFAELQLGNVPEAEEHLERAIAELQEAKYVSGLARARLASALLFARRGKADQALTEATESVNALAGADVYPGLIVLSYRLAERLGEPIPGLRENAAQALNRLKVVDGLDAFERRMNRHLSSWVDDDLERSRERAIARPNIRLAEGNYNENVIDGDVLFRTPKGMADDMDLRLWPQEEHVVLWAANQAKLPAPQLLASAGHDPRFQVHEFIPGKTLEDLYPGPSPVPDEVARLLGSFLGQLAAVQKGDLPALPDSWPRSGTAEFAAILLDKTKGIHQRAAETHGDLLTRLGIPPKPFECLDFAMLSARPFQLVHSDVHRRNVIQVDEHDLDNERPLVVLDWELALWGDPAYDLAVHLHKMRYTPDQAEIATRSRIEGDEDEQAAWRRDVDAYRQHETVKSAIVDSVRYSERMLEATRDSGPDSREARQIAMKLATKLNAARQLWGANDDLDADRVLSAVASS